MSPKQSKGKAAADPAEENRRRFREALERKNAADHCHPHSDAEGGTHLKGSSDNRKRQFRRKSG
jgi:hypothetical protein